MTRFLQQLQSNEAILQMYLAGELPEVDREEVRQMLASDPTLRNELEEIRSAHEAAFAMLRDLDAGSHPVMSPAQASARIGTLINQWTDERLRPAMLLPQTPRALPWWRYSLSAAAMLMFSYYVWTVYHIKSPTELPSLTWNEPTPPVFSSQPPPDDFAPLQPPAPPRELSSEEKVALLSNSLEDSISDETPNLHVAELAAIIPSGGSTNDADQPGDSSSVPLRQDSVDQQ
jgi:hypothetical protein